MILVSLARRHSDTHLVSEQGEYYRVSNADRLEDGYWYYVELIGIPGNRSIRRVLCCMPVTVTGQPR
jgi:hypothetical protein